MSPDNLRGNVNMPDRDGGGTMDRIELSVALVQVGVWLHPKEVTILMDALDADGRFTLVRPPRSPLRARASAHARHAAPLLLRIWILTFPPNDCGSGEIDEKEFIIFWNAVVDLDQGNPLVYPTPLHDP
jgi:hypothetical protein